MILQQTTSNIWKRYVNKKHKSKMVYRSLSVHFRILFSSLKLERYLARLFRETFCEKKIVGKILFQNLSVFGHSALIMYLLCIGLQFVLQFTDQDGYFTHYTATSEQVPPDPLALSGRSFPSRYLHECRKFRCNTLNVHVLIRILNHSHQGPM